MSALAQPAPQSVARPAALARGLRIADRASNVLFALALLLLAALLAGSILGYRPLVEYSGSMSPAINPGDLLITRPAPAVSVHPGAIVTFNDPALRGRLVTHRVIAMHDSRGRLQFVTRGDANATAESWSVARGGTVAVLRARIPWVGRATAWMLAGLARTLALSLLALVLSIAVLRRIWRA
jgi:signal peptidase I